MKWMLTFWNENTIVKLRYMHFSSNTKVCVGGEGVTQMQTYVFFWFTNKLYLHLKKYTHIICRIWCVWQSYTAIKWPRHPKIQCSVSLIGFIMHFVQLTLPTNLFYNFRLFWLSLKFHINIIILYVLSESWSFSLKKMLFLVCD